MKYLLDTNICIYIMKNNPPQVLKHFRNLAPGQVLISSITLAELRFGVEKSIHKEKNNIALSEFILPLELVYFDEYSAYHYGIIRAYLEKKGYTIGPLDLMIASQAKSLNVTLVTNNVKEFSRVPNLHIRDWTKSSVTT